MGDTTAIRINDLVKNYGRFRALDGASLAVPAGTIFGFLGPNGSGKTTTLRTIMGMLRATAGSVDVLGLDPWRDRVRLHARVGYLPSGMGFYERMTGRDLLDYTASLMPAAGRDSPLRPDALEALAISQDMLDRPIRDYSKGMRQKLAVVQALQHDPELLLLDEPSEGFDPLVQHSFYEFLRARRDAGRTIFFSSHTLSEVQALCDHVAIIRQGKVVASSTYEELARQHPRVVRLTSESFTDATLVRLGEGWKIAQRDTPTQVTLHTTAAPVEIVRALAALEFDDVTIEQPSLEDVFLGYYEADGASGGQS